MMSLPNTMDILNHFKLDIHVNSIKKFACVKGHCVPITKTNRLMLFRKTITVYSETH